MQSNCDLIFVLPIIVSVYNAVIFILIQNKKCYDCAIILFNNDINFHSTKYNL